MKVVTLGTGSGKPTLKRNVSATAVVRQGEWLLFDCGEATQIQVLRAGLRQSRLSAIFITHLHGDHFNGLAGLLSSMSLDGRSRGLTIIGPAGIRDYLEGISRLRILSVNYDLKVEEFCREAFSAAEPLTVYETESYFVKALPLSHRVFTLGYRLEEKPRPGRFLLERARQLGIPEGPLYGKLQSGQSVQLEDGTLIHPSEVVGEPRPGKSLAYVTDTRPCEAARLLSSQVNLLLHEATFTEDLAEEAKKWGHSTAAEAASIARSSQARKLLLVHFSPRYVDAEPLLAEARAIFPHTQLAEDLMETEV
jgi:ribonuclease Z